MTQQHNTEATEDPIAELEEKVEDLPWDSPEPEEDTSTAVVQKQSAIAMTASEAMSLGEIAVQALVGGSANQYEAAMKIIRGHELGIGAAASIENIYVVNNRTAMSAGLIGSLIKSSDKYNFKVEEHDSDHCKIDFYEEDIFCGTSEFSMEDAKRAKLVKPNSPWLSYPRNMVYARALTNGARWYCPDVFQGHVYTPEELGERAVTAGSPAQTTTSVSQPAAQPLQVAQSTPTPPIAPEPFSREEYDGTIDWSTEECPIHRNHAGSLKSAYYQGQPRPVAFFKGGRMRQHAHNTGDGWCNRDNVIRDLRADVELLIDGRDKAFGQLTEDRYPDIHGVPREDWRASDWFDLKAVVLVGLPETSEDETEDSNDTLVI